MTDLETALRLLAIEEKWVQPFAVQDPFGDLALEGYLSLRPDHRYGALAITRVDGRPAPQRVLATPKIRYPFDRGGTFRFPPVAGITIYEKLDGTNVLAYRYLDADGGLHTTYKLRLFSVLRNSKWGPFLDMWNEMLARYPAIATLAEVNGCAVSFELYGSRNAHLVLYDSPSTVRCSSGSRQTARPFARWTSTSGAFPPRDSTASLRQLAIRSRSTPASGRRWSAISRSSKTTNCVAGRVRSGT
jgi:hypothetical protein